MKSTADLLLIAGTGAKLIIDAKEKTTSDIIQIVGSVGLKDSHITIANSHVKTTADLLLIAQVYPKNITFDFVQHKEKETMYR